MAAYGARQHGKEEVRKELALLAMAHRDVFVLQSSQASPSHLLGGVLRGLQSKHPAVFVLHCPCPPEHGLGDADAVHAARLALESRAFPHLLYDPAEGPTVADRLSLDGNPSPDEKWPTYELKYVDDDGDEQTMTLPLTIADWAATESRFRKHFRAVPPDVDPDTLMGFDEYLRLGADERADVVPFVYVLDGSRRLARRIPSAEIVDLAAERLQYWSQLKQLAGLEVPPAARDTVEAQLEEEYERRRTALEQEYQRQLASLRAEYPQRIARRLAEGLIRAGRSGQTIGQLLAEVEALPALEPVPPDGNGTAAASGVAVGVPAAAAPETAVAEPTPEAVEAEDEEALVMEPYIETARCTTCDECTNLNKRMFAYNENKQAYIKDPRGGTFRELVMAAERCPVGIIHPGTPLNPKERDLEKWIKRAERFN